MRQSIFFNHHLATTIIKDEKPWFLAFALKTPEEKTNVLGVGVTKITAKKILNFTASPFVYGHKSQE